MGVGCPWQHAVRCCTQQRRAKSMSSSGAPQVSFDFSSRIPASRTVNQGMLVASYGAHAYESIPNPSVRCKVWGVRFDSTHKSSADIVHCGAEQRAKGAHSSRVQDVIIRSFCSRRRECARVYEAVIGSKGRWFMQHCPFHMFILSPVLR